MNELNKFCDLLSEMLKNYGKSHISFYTELGIKKPYFYDILSGKSNPPPPEKQFKMIQILKPSFKDCELFFELAAKERNEMPADLMHYIDYHMRTSLRESQEYKNMMNYIIEGDKENVR